MKKTLGQTGLNFIANKYKELRTALSNKVDKVQGKGLSTNDYDSTAKSKVDAIPSNPKYTDTTYDLSKYAEKSDITRCKTRGYDVASSWLSPSSGRDLGDWIGDFDKRTRELKENKGLTGAHSEIKQQIIKNTYLPNDGVLVAAKWGRIVNLTGGYNSDKLKNGMRFSVPTEFAPPHSCVLACHDGHANLAIDTDSNNYVINFEITFVQNSNSPLRNFDWNLTYFAASL